MKTKIKKFVKLLGIGNLCLMSFFFLQVFYIAYFSPSRSVTMFINKLGEAQLEFWIIIPYLIITAIISLYFIFRGEVE